MLLRSAYFLAKNRIPHTTVYPHLVNLQVANGDNLLEQHMAESNYFDSCKSSYFGYMKEEKKLRVIS